MTRDDVDRLADLVAEDAEVDWAAIERSANPADVTIVRQLRVLHQIARLHHEKRDAARDAAPEPRAAWGHLTRRRRIAAGAHGDVYLAWDPRLEREVALKLVRAEIANVAAPEAIDEARLLARVRHPNVITIFGAERRDGRVGLWMELIDGSTLAAIIREMGPLSPDETVLLGITLCQALSAVHRAGLLHRDLKAENVMRERGGRIVLMDFGAGRERGQVPPEGPELAGTPLYLAPEVFENGAATVRSDIYSLGVLLYYAVSGAFPVSGRTLLELREAHRAARYVPLHEVRPEVPANMVQAIEKALSPSPADRYGSAGEMASALTRALALPEPVSPAPPARTPAWLWKAATAGLAAIAAVVTAAWLWSDPGPSDFTVRRVTFRHGRVVTARFAPDARTVVYSAEWGGDPRDLFSTAFESLESRPLRQPDTSVLAVSVRGDLALLVRPRFLRGYQEVGTLARMPFGGGTPRELLGDVQGADWSPDGEALAIVREDAGRSRLEFPIGTRLYDTSGWISSIRVSPDGERVAFIDHPTPADDSGRVAVVDGAGRRAVLTGRWVSAQGLAWSPDGREIWFSATESGNRRAIYAVDLGGAERVVRRMLSNLRLHDVSRDGRVLATEDSIRVGILGRSPGDDRERDLAWLDWSLARDLSADGRLLLINESGEGGGAEYAVYLRPMDGSPAMRLSEGSGMAISPDARWVLASRPGKGLWLLPTGSGVPRALPPGPQRYQQWGTWSADGQRVIYAGVDEQGTSRVYVQDIDGGLPTPLTGDGVFLTSSDPVSPDGTRLAAVGPDQFAAIYRMDGGPPVRIPGVAAGEVPIHWSADGRSLFMWQRGEAPARVHVVETDTGARTLWRELMPADPSGVHEILRIVLSGDATTYAYSYTRELSTLHLIQGLR